MCAVFRWTIIRREEVGVNLTNTGQLLPRPRHAA